MRRRNHDSRVVVSLASLVPSHLHELRNVFVATHHRLRVTMRPSRYARFSTPTLTANQTRIVSHAVRASDKDSQKSQKKIARWAQKHNKATKDTCALTYCSLNDPEGIPNAFATLSAGIIRNAYSSCKSNGSSNSSSIANASRSANCFATSAARLAR